MLGQSASSLRGGARAFAGVCVAPEQGRLAAAILDVRGVGLEARVEIQGGVHRALPKRLAASLRHLDGDGALPPSALAGLSAELAGCQAELVRDLLCRGSGPPELLALGAREPGLWSSGGQAGAAMLALGDAARLAEATGLNVIDAFETRDVAVGGRGGPVSAIALWVLLHHVKRNRVLLDLGERSRLIYLPAGCEAHAASGVMAFDAGPGTALLERLGHQLSCGPREQPEWRGRIVGPLLSRLLADFQTCHDEEPVDRAHRNLFRQLRSRCAEHAPADLLETAAQLVAATIVQAIGPHIPKSPPGAELVLTGPGSGHWRLIADIRRQLGAVPCVPVSATGFSERCIGAACAAVLAQLHVDQVPQTSMFTTGILTPRVLGRLTPGSPQSWRRLVDHMAAAAPRMVPLRAAV